MAIKLNGKEATFRNELIFAADAKAVKIENTLVNLFMLIKHNGLRPKQRARRGESVFVEIEKLIHVFKKIEEKNDHLDGFSDNPEAIELWLRSNLVNMVNRGNIEKEKISSLRPIHLESYKIRNAPNTRDYFSADQVYLMLSENPQVRDRLREFLSQGWDKDLNTLRNARELDIDSLGILYLIRDIKPGFIESRSALNKIRPILVKQAELFCEDIRKLLVYESHIPRSVLIDYLKTITSFHLSLYTHKIIKLLPRMIEQGTTDVEDNWSIVLDVTDDFESKISSIAIADAEKTYNSLYNYIKATFKINSIISHFNLDEKDSDSIEKVLTILKEKQEEIKYKFDAYWMLIYNQSDHDDDDRELIDEMTKYEESSFDKYIELLVKIKGPYQRKFFPRFLDNISQKNDERGFLSQGRSKKHPRRYTLGTKLLEALVQLQVLHLENNGFITKSLSIEELMNNLKERYGLIINGLNEERFQNSDLNTHLAFKENVEAFKLKLRQIGFYSDLSDAYILQKIRPRYELV